MCSSSLCQSPAPSSNPHARAHVTHAMLLQPSHARTRDPRHAVQVLLPCLHTHARTHAHTRAHTHMHTHARTHMTHTMMSRCYCPACTHTHTHTRDPCHAVQVLLPSLVAACYEDERACEVVAGHVSMQLLHSYVKVGGWVGGLYMCLPACLNLSRLSNPPLPTCYGLLLLSACPVCLTCSCLPANRQPATAVAGSVGRRPGGSSGGGSWRRGRGRGGGRGRHCYCYCSRRPAQDKGACRSSRYGYGYCYCH